METAVEENHKESTENVVNPNNVQEKTPTPPPQEQPRRSKKEDRLKKEDKYVDQFMKSLNSLPTVEDKFSSVCKKYVQTADESKKLQFYIKQSDKRYALLVKEKDQLQHEFNKAILVKSKLENLCRELQKQNKAIKEESLLKIREGEERHKETQAKVQNTLSEITSLLQQNNEKNTKLREDNISMSEKFKSVVQQYQLREQQVDKMAKQMALESQLSDAKLQKASLEHQAEKERILAEMEQLKVNLAQYRAKIMELQGTETALRGQLGVYTDKYDEFQNALVKSNQVFGGFKEQMEKMSKKIKKLEKESLSWKQRWESSQTALVDMCGERQASEERAAASARQLHHMQSLCRTLQGERTVLLSTLKENNIERPPLPAAAPAPAPLPPAPTPASNAKVDAMAANCVQLRQSLANLQSKLNVLTNNKNKEESPIPEPKQKKSKSKKNKGEKQAQKVEETTEVKEPESDESIAAKEVKETEPSANVSTVQNEINSEPILQNEINSEPIVQNEINSEPIVQNEINSEPTVENEENAEATQDEPKETVDDKTLENLIQAINSANINLCDLEVKEENDEAKLDEVLSIEVNKNILTEGNVSITEVSTEKINEGAVDKFIEVNSTNEDINVSLQEINSNDEVSHILEVKPISDKS